MNNVNYCRNCGKKVPIDMRKDAKHCNDYCKKRYWDKVNGRIKPKNANISVPNSHSTTLSLSVLKNE